MNRPILLLSLLFTLTAAHSNLGYPLPYSKTACKGDQSYCDKPCPPVWGNAQNSPENPSATWRRGQRVTITWHKNNHIGGFYRRSLVPVKHMYDWDWHQKTAFEWGCWGQGTFKCGQSPLCGGDKQGRAYRNDITVPGIFPDGDYVFAQVWYGGIHWRGRQPKYADYYACSFVRIRGGTMKNKHKPSFRPNPNPAKRAHNLGSFANNVCATGSTRLRECGGDACEHKPVRYTVPDEFEGGTSPNPIPASLFGHEVSPDDEVPETEVSTNMQEDALKENQEDKREDAMAAAEEEKQEKQIASPHHDEHPVQMKNKKEDESNPIRAVRVSIAGRDVIQLANGARAKVKLDVENGVDFDVLVHCNAKIRNVKLVRPSNARAVQWRAPYTFHSSHPPRDTWVPLIFQVDRSYFKILLFFPNKKLITKKGTAAAQSSEGSHSDGDCSLENIPPPPVGAWDARYSKKWWFNRNRFVARREYCRRCRLDCS